MAWGTFWVWRVLCWTRMNASYIFRHLLRNLSGPFKVRRVVGVVVVVCGCVWCELYVVFAFDFVMAEHAFPCALLVPLLFLSSPSFLRWPCPPLYSLLSMCSLLWTVPLLGCSWWGLARSLVSLLMWQSLCFSGFFRRSVTISCERISGTLVWNAVVSHCCDRMQGSSR